MILEEVFEVFILISRFCLNPESNSYTDSGVQRYTFSNRLEFIQ
jgi:hypothetical protein